MTRGRSRQREIGRRLATVLQAAAFLRLRRRVRLRRALSARTCPLIKWARAFNQLALELLPLPTGQNRRDVSGELSSWSWSSAAAAPAAAWPSRPTRGNSTEFIMLAHRRARRQQWRRVWRPATEPPDRVDSFDSAAGRLVSKVDTDHVCARAGGPRRASACAKAEASSQSQRALIQVTFRSRRRECDLAPATSHSSSGQVEGGDDDDDQCAASSSSGSGQWGSAVGAHVAPPRGCHRSPDDSGGPDFEETAASRGRRRRQRRRHANKGASRAPPVGASPRGS